MSFNALNTTSKFICAIIIFSYLEVKLELCHNTSYLLCQDDLEICVFLLQYGSEICVFLLQWDFENSSVFQNFKQQKNTIGGRDSAFLLFRAIA